MSQSKLLRKLEYLLVAASAAGLIFALEAKKSSLWAIVPLTGTMVVNVFNRRIEDKNSTQYAIEELADIEQRMLNKIQWLEDVVKTLPPPIEPSRIEKLEEITKLNKEVLAGLETRFLNVAALYSSFPELQKNVQDYKTDLEDNKQEIELIRETLKSLPTRIDLELQTKETFNILQSKQKIYEEDLAALTDKTNSISWHVEDFSKLDRKVNRLQEELNSILKQHEIESLTTELDGPVGVYSFTSVAKAIENLKEQNTDSQSAIFQLQKVLQDFPSNEEIEQIKYQLQETETKLTNTLSESVELQEIKAEISELKTELDRQKLTKQLEEENREHSNKNLFSWLSNRF